MKRMWKSGLALFLAGLMTLTPVLESVAANLSTDNVNDVIMVEETSEENATKAAEVESEKETETESTSEATPESGIETETESETEMETEAEPVAETENEPETETNPETGAETEQESETEIATEVEIETVTETVVEIETETVVETETETETEDEDNWRGTGHKAPQLEMTMTASMMAEKCELEGTAELIEELEENIEYVANEAVFLASSKEYAQKVAKGYGAELLSYGDGVAVITFDDAVEEILAMAEDEEVKLPAVYPNYIYTSYSTEGVESIALDGATQKKQPDPDLYKQTYHSDIHTSGAWEYNSAAGKGIKVAVLDSGINKAHEDLKGRVASASVTYSTPYNKSEDNAGQGTHVAGIIAANKDNGIGGAGIAYNASIISIKVLEKNSLYPNEKITGSTSDIVKAVNNSVKSGARVISMGFATEYYDGLLENVVNNAVNKGVVVVAAAGDEGKKLTVDKVDNGDEYGKYYYSPACFENVITVASTSGSNCGDGIIDITAPGANVLSTVPSKLYGNSYEKLGGTAQATAMVSASAAYIFSVRSDLVSQKSKTTVDTVKRLLQDSATVSGYADSAKYGAGLLNVEAAVKMAAPSAKNDTALQAPVVKIDGKTVVKNQKIQNTDKITLSSALGSQANDNIKIYYTLDGKTPTEKSALYNETEPFSIEASGKKTIKAIAVYYGKKSSVTTLSVTVNANAESFTIASKSGYNYLSSGKSLTMKAGNFVPSYTTKKTVTWKITSGNAYASINEKTGVITAVKGVTEMQEVTVEATATDGSGVKADPVIIKIVPAITVFRLSDNSQKSLTLKHDEGKTVNVPIEINLTDQSDLPVVGSSSNSKVATVTITKKGIGKDEEGNQLWEQKFGIKTVGSGNATLTLKTIDGSNKKITIKVKVTKGVESCTVRSKNGEYQLASGNSLQMVAEVTSDATNKKVNWSIVSGGEAATISNNGVLTAKKGLKEKTKVTVKATPADNASVAQTQYIIVYPCSTQKLGVLGGTSYKIGTMKRGDIEKTVQLYPYTENYKSDSYFGRGKSNNDKDENLKNFTYTSTNPKVATVDEKGLVTAVSEGTTKIKIVARDGSNKSITCTIKVIKPVTSMAVYLKSTAQSYNLGKGKTLNLGVVFYNGATEKKVEWTSNRTSIATVDKNGKVTAINYGTGEEKVTITAKATDGSGTEAIYIVDVKPVITKLAYEKENPTTGKVTYSTSSTMKMELGESIKESDIRPCYFDETSKDVPRTVEKVETNEAEGTETVTVEPYWDEASVSYSCSNSNVIQIVKNKNGEKCLVAVNTGTAYITYKALDGSGKSCKMKIQVVKP